ncbi:MAG TPA: hypothetical protein VJ124_07800 [Pyrinomonadaceae bacterium]|nr:hypothetical protein [Pyrinomonadaceae bacterium]
MTSIYWIDGSWSGRLALVSRPRGGDWLETDVRAWASAGINVVVSLLTRPEVGQFELLQEATLCCDQDIQFLQFPIVDRRVPMSYDTSLTFVKKLEETLSHGRNIGIHCRQSIGRSAIIASAILVLAGVEPERSLKIVAKARGMTVPETQEQRDWVMSFGKEIMAPAN